MKINLLIPRHTSRRLVGMWLLVFATVGSVALAYERYNDGCPTCHGAFTGSTSPQGTVFPSGDKHRMHRSSANMGTSCALCHTSGDNNDPFIGSSDGIGNVPGLGCTGCHNAAGLRKHHATTGTTVCAGCHTAPETPPTENVSPPYYGTAYTKARNPCNDVRASNTNENWSVGDFIGLDNDGNNLYDVADFACGPYKILSANREGNNMRITWQTAGGRRDVVQASPSVRGTFTNLHTPITMPGTGVITTNYLEIGGATNRPARLYRVKYSP